MTVFVSFCLLLGIISTYYNPLQFNLLVTLFTIFYIVHIITLQLVGFFISNKSHIVSFLIFGSIVLLVLNLFELFYNTTLIIFLISSISLYFFSFGFTQFKSKYPIISIIILGSFLLISIITLSMLLGDLFNLLYKALMNSNGPSDGPSSSSNRNNNPSGPNKPNRGGSSGNHWGVNKPHVYTRKRRSAYNNISELDSDKLMSIRGRSHNLLNRLNATDPRVIQYLEIRRDLISNEIKRHRFIESLHSDALNEEFLYRTTKISQYIMGENPYAD